MNGVAPSEVRDEMNANAARREALQAKLAAADEPPPLLHPEMARIYRAKVTELARALQEPDSRSKCTGQRDHFVSNAGQLTTSVIVPGDSCLETLLIRKRSPSAETSYR